MRGGHELAEVGKVLVGVGAGGYGGWLATMASVDGSGASFKVWTIWSVLLVVLSGVAVAGGVVLWWVFRDRSRHTYIPVPPGSVVTVQPGTPGATAAAARTPPTSSTSPNA